MLLHNRMVQNVVLQSASLTAAVVQLVLLRHPGVKQPIPVATGRAVTGKKERVGRMRMGWRQIHLLCLLLSIVSAGSSVVRSSTLSMLDHALSSKAGDE